MSIQLSGPAARPVDVINSSVKAGVSVGTFKISRAQADELRRLEQDKPEAALGYLLRCLRVEIAVGTEAGK